MFIRLIYKRTSRRTSSRTFGSFTGLEIYFISDVYSSQMKTLNSILNYHKYHFRKRKGIWLPKAKYMKNIKSNHVQCIRKKVNK
ncbi:hypothetical protein HanIR_Chr16g0841071 [Helianthus annuus]|nr:hypothetical protein HanIR_Chr16g0841071 [Helianthus annuus]